MSIKPTNCMKLEIAMFKLTFMTENMCVATHMELHSQKLLTSRIASVKRGTFDRHMTLYLKHQTKS